MFTNICKSLMVVFTIYLMYLCTVRGEYDKHVIYAKLKATHQFNTGGH
jgi:hypothetical protein